MVTKNIPMRFCYSPIRTVGGVRKSMKKMAKNYQFITKNRSATKHIPGCYFFQYASTLAISWRSDLGKGFKIVEMHRRGEMVMRWHTVQNNKKKVTRWQTFQLNICNRSQTKIHTIIPFKDFLKIFCSELLTVPNYPPLPYTYISII